MWHWQAPHPEWTPKDDWEQTDVSSYAIDNGELLLFFDPLAMPDEIEALAAERGSAIVLTSPWHQRDALAVAERLDAPIYAPPPEEDPDPIGGLVFRAGDRLPVGVTAFPGREEPHDVVLYIENRSAVVAGDTLVDRGQGIEILEEWLPDGVTREQVVEGLHPLLDLNIEVVLPTHGPPSDRAALERALA